MGSVDAEKVASEGACREVACTKGCADAGALTGYYFLYGHATTCLLTHHYIAVLHLLSYVHARP